MSSVRYGDANLNGAGCSPRQSQQMRHKSITTEAFLHPGGLTFREFTRDSLEQIRRRRQHQNEKKTRLLSNLNQTDAQTSNAFVINPRAGQLEPDQALASGQQLPHAIMRQLPIELLGKPIEDIDPYYADQETFVVVSKSKELTRFSANKALYFLDAFHPVRRIVIYILVNPMFSLFVILTILANCILMTLQGGDMVERTEIIFTIIYTTEMGLKVLARGFILDKFTYLRDPWNWLDFLVIVMAYLTIVIEDLGNLSVMRTFRVLRALKTVAIIPGMKTIVGAVIDSVKNLKDVVVLTLFSLSVFSLLGLQIYMGQLTQKCILDGPKNMTDIEWFTWVSNSSHWVPEPDDEIFGAYRLCGNASGAQSCPSNHTCLQGFGPNPDYGFTNFDTFGWALICSFRLMTQDFWEGLYMQVLKTAGSWHIIFFLVSIFLGSIYLMNLILAIVAMSYNELQRRAEEEEEAAAMDEAAFLESCRLMELAEQLGSEISTSTAGAPGAQFTASYRPSVEIGLAGQSLLASLCQNGLLGQRVIDKLNQHIKLTGQDEAHVNQVYNQIRSHSLSCDIEQHKAPCQTERHFSVVSYREPIKRSSLTAPSVCQVSSSVIDPKNIAKSTSTSTEAVKKSSIVSYPEISEGYIVSSTTRSMSPACLQELRGGARTSGYTSPISREHFKDEPVRFGEQVPRKDLNLLKQRAAMIRIVSVKKSRCKADLLADKSENAQSLDQMQLTTTCEPQKESSARRRQKLVRRFSSSAAKYRLTRSGDQSEDFSEQQGGVLLLDEPSKLENSEARERDSDTLNIDSRRPPVESKFHSDVAICTQPASSNPFRYQLPMQNQSSSLEDVPELKADQRYQSKLRGRYVHSIRSPIRPLLSRSKLSPTAQLGGSALVLCQHQLSRNSSATTSPVNSLGSAATIHQLGVDRVKMHHLSVENFQLFGAQQRSISGRHSLTPSNIFLQGDLSNRCTLSSQGKESRLRPETQGNIRPDTIVRPRAGQLARPRPSFALDVPSQTNKPSSVRDFSRRASDWSRMSMSAGVDLRRLLRLWSHTNPYQPRPSIGSFSNYSQAVESPVCSMQDLRKESPSVNSPRPSSVGSARQAYELISAFSRRHQRYPYDYRYSLAMDDDAKDEISVNFRDKCIAYCLSCLDMLCIWECCAPWLALQRMIAAIVFDPFTELFIILCILINTLFMALDSNDTDPHMKIIFERGNYFFTATFAVEASMKILALSPKFYFREGWNVFDSIIVGLSLLELGLEGVYGLSVLRSFRLLRVFKLAKSWPTLNLLISIMGKAMGDLGNLTFVLAIIVFIFAVMGMQLFGNKYVDSNFPSGELPRWNFTDFMHSFMIVFRILCAEWIEPMWDCLLVGGWPCIPFFLIAVTVGNLVVLNLFLALLLASFGASNLSSPQADNVDTKKLQDAIARFSRFGRWIKRHLNNLVRQVIAGITCKRYRGARGLDDMSTPSRTNEPNYKLKSHIATMSKLERMKSIEARTEELKSKIKRSPEHHYHLRQLAQHQLKESRRNRSEPVSTSHGLNYNYSKRTNIQAGSTGDYMAQDFGCYTPATPIPIIVNEVSIGEVSSESRSVSNSIEVDEVELQEIVTNSPEVMKQASSRSHRSYSLNMQPIIEDAHDTDPCEFNNEPHSIYPSLSGEVTKITIGDNDGIQLEESGNTDQSLANELELDLQSDQDAGDRPKSSLYLKAPERQDMDEDDDRALQHIEKYMESCICLGIVCLKWFLFRQYVRKLVEHRYFDQCILALIVISSGTLALEDKHLNERPNLKRTLDVLDTIFTIVFSLEMILKWLAFGIRRYFGNIWSWLDFLIVLVSFINLLASIFGSGKIQALKTMRTLRAMRGLRPLRALQRFQGMRVVVNALIQAIPSIFNVLLVCLIFWLIFSIMGVQMFGGKFWRCVHPQTKRVVTYEEAANRFECIERNLTWSNPQINFDNVLNAYLALFQVATFKGWIDIMNSATDSRAHDVQPTREANIYMYFYFVFFVIFGSFFTLNLFIGVIIDNFNEQKKKTGGSLEIFMTEDQKKYYHAMKKMRSKRPIKAMTRPKLKIQAYMFDITTSKKFDLAIMIIIGLNMFIMALEHYGQSIEFTMALEDLNLVFISIFALESLCKIFAMRHFYFREPWNVFDFIVVDLSIIGYVMKEYVAKYFVSPTLLRVVRVVKVGRVLRLVKGAKGIRTLLFALAMSLPALFNICLLLFLVMFIYAIFGMSFFMNVRPRSGIDETFNFETFPSSIIVLFQMSTSAGWDLVLDPLMDEENDCQKPDPTLGIEGTCGNKSVAIFYLISYVIVTFLIIINMYIAVILENYSQATEDVQEGLTDDDYEMYYEIWQKFDPDGAQFLPYEKLSDFVDSLEDPLRIPKPNDLALVILDINIYEGNLCYCVDILDALTKYFFTRKGLVIQVNEQLKKVQSSLHETAFQTITTTYMLKRQNYCAKVIQNCWRKWRARTQEAMEGRINQIGLNLGD